MPEIRHNANGTTFETFTTAEAAALLKLQKRTLEDWRYKGIGPAFIAYNHRCIRYRLADLIAYQKSCLVRPPGLADGVTA